MALRRIVKDGDAVLLKKSREVNEFDCRLHDLLDDLGETMMDADGLGLAAPQVGVLRRVVVVLGPDERIIELVNPEIVATDGMVNGAEGCLSFPNLWGAVERPEQVTVRAQNRHGEFFEVTGDGITARAFCHEIDHLNGVVFTNLVNRYLSAEEVEDMRGGDADEE